MRRNTITWRIFKYNIIVIILLIAITTIVFNFTIRYYIEQDIIKQLDTIASHAEKAVLFKGPDFFPPEDFKKLPPPHDTANFQFPENNNVFRFYFILDRALREPLSLLNADYILVDNNKEILTSPVENYFGKSEAVVNKLSQYLEGSTSDKAPDHIRFKHEGIEYIAIIKPVYDKNTFGLSWIIIYSSLQKVNQLQININAILLVILLFSSIFMAIFSSLVAKKISSPFSSLNHHIREISERNFGTKIHIPVTDELQDFVNNINSMSQKLESYDKAQKTFLQNVSHEFRTPLMSIQSYAEGIKYNVVEHLVASDIIIEETNRMTNLVADLLYLSRLDAIEENYNYDTLDLGDLLKGCAQRMNPIAANKNIKLLYNDSSSKIELLVDEEKLSRAFINIIDNCIRYANTTVTVDISCKESNKSVYIKIYDDGPGFDPKDLPNIFERFYKGKKGVFGLGLAISKNVIEKHNGKIEAQNKTGGALFTIVFPLY